MLRQLILTALVLLPCMGDTVPTDHRDVYTRSDIEGMYAAAKATLEDPAQIHVERVPDMLEQCAQQGHPRAARLLIDVYEGKFKGLGEEPQKAFEVATKVATAEIPFPNDEECRAMQTEAVFHLARYYEKGYGCERDPEHAMQLMETAAAELPEAKVALARMLMLRDKETPNNPKRAWQLLHEVANTAPNTRHVFLYMGVLCLQEHTRRSARKAARLFYYGALYQDAECINNLGAMYERGVAVRKDSAKALSLYRKAAALGNKHASANMQRLAFKEGEAAGRRLITPPQVRIRRAGLRVIDNLPIKESSKERLLQWLRGEKAQSHS